MSKKFHYHENWAGKRKEFKSLKSAVNSAEKESGAISIFNSEGLVKIIQGNGLMYP